MVSGCESAPGAGRKRSIESRRDRGPRGPVDEDRGVASTGRDKGLFGSDVDHVDAAP